MVKSIKCSRHVKSSQNCYFSRDNGFHDVISEFEQSGLSPNGICDMQTAKGRNWEIRICEEKDELGRDARAFCQ